MALPDDLQIGQAVQYVPSVFDLFAYNQGSHAEPQRVAAIVTNVDEDAGTVNLYIFPDQRPPLFRNGIKHYQDRDGDTANSFLLVGESIVTETGDEDVDAFISAAGIVDTTIITALLNLVTGLKDANLWVKMIAIYPFVGGTAAAHKFNLKDPRDLDAAFRLTFTGGIIHSANGAEFDGSSGYANTHLIPSTNISSFLSAHLSFYNNKILSASCSVYDMGCGTVSGDKLLSLVAKRSTTGDRYFDSWEYPAGQLQFSSAGDTDNRGFFNGSRTTENDVAYYLNGVSVSSSGEIITGDTRPTIECYLGGFNEVGGGVYYSLNRLAFATIGDGLLSPEASTFYALVQDFQIALSRNA